jgi:hypothetical protein
MHLWEPPDEILIDEDAVLRGQGADPAVIRQRSPRLVEDARRAVEEGKKYLEPQVLVQKLKVKSVRHERVVLEDGKKLSGSLVATHLGQAEYIVLLLCTVGDRLEEHVSAVMEEDIVFGLALDGVGSAAVEAIANAACKYFEDEAAAIGFQASIPLSPGMIGWEVQDGQPELFNIFDATKVNVSLSPHAIMTPRKSLTMAIGFGPEMNLGGRTCDFCAMKETCQYKDHYEPIL